MLRIALTSLAAFLACRAISETKPLVRTAAELRDVLVQNVGLGVPFRLEGTIELGDRPQNNRLTLIDETGAVMLFRDGSLKGLVAKPGDRVRLSGYTSYYDKPRRLVCASCDHVTTLSHGEPPPVQTVRYDEFASGRHDFRIVRVRGLVHNAFRDEIDPRYFVLLLGDGKARLHVMACSDDADPDLGAYVGAEVDVVGLCDPSPLGSRLHLGRILAPQAVSNIVIRRSSGGDVFAVPDVSELRNKPAHEIISSGRHKATGRILARWNDDRRLVLRTDGGAVVNADLGGGKAPDIGTHVEISGMPETDLFRINLSQATWRPVADSASRQPDVPKALSVAALLVDASGRPQIETTYHGQLVTIRGTVRSVIEPKSGSTRLVLEDGGLTLPVDIGPISRSVAEVGTRIAATGVYIVETDPSPAADAFPRIRDVFLVVGDPAGITVLSAAPFWTPSRLLTVIGTLTAVLIGIILWNLSLRTHVRRKTRELEREIANGLEAELRIHERTRLATELHDSISQNLTGVALALDDVGAAIAADNAEARARLDIAARTLKSCRGELRNCLWDLRNDALEEPEIDDAIRRTLAPHVRDTNLAIRFRAARDAFTDNTLHTILCIIRELTVNAIRHGGARNVRIAGSLEDGELRFSVTDDGCGFDPATRPGIDSGHFGLQGVQERAEGLGGAMTLRSQPGKGAKITISIRLRTTASNG